MRRLGLLLALGLLAAACDYRSEYIAQPSGLIVDTPTATVTGHVPAEAVAGGTLVVNGVTATIEGDGTWSAEIPMDTDSYVTPVTAIYTSPDNHNYIQESTLIYGEKVDDGEFSSNGVGMLFTNGGLAGLGPVINSLAGGSFDISALILAQDPLIPPTSAGSGVTITGKAYEAGAESVSLSTTSTASGVKTPITVKNLYLGLDLTLSGLISGPCKLEIEVPTTTIDATFDLAPAADKVDVNMVGDPTVTLTGVSYEFISGVCDPSTPLLGSIINSQAGGAIEGSIKGGFTTQLKDPDGNGPNDSPISDAIETALGNISIAGSVGEAVKANLDAPFTSITESGTGIDFRADADFYTTFGTGPTDCQPPAGAPDFTSSYHVPGTYPGLGATTPTGGVPYGLGLVISTSAFDQLLSAMTECGLLNQDLTEIALGGNTLPVTSSVLSLLVPEFGSKLPPNTPMLIRLDPQAAPFLTDAATGPGDTPAEMFLADLRIEFIQPFTDGNGAHEKLWLSLSVDAPLGFELAFDEAAGQLAPTITPPTGDQVTTRAHVNDIGTNEANIETVFSQLFPNFVSSLGASFGAFPLPSFLGLNLQVLEVARHGEYYTLYSNLNPAPQTRLANVAVTDLSTADYSNDSVLFDSWEWRHSIRKQVGANQVKVNFDGMLGADACCTVDDESDSAHAGYRVAFDVIPENGETWKLDLAQAIKGAHTAKDEGYGAQSNISRITGRYRLDGGAWTEFSFDVGSDGNPSETTPWQGGWSGGTFNEPFIGSAATSLQGNTARSVVVEFGFDMTAWSDSHLAFPAEAGNEIAIRLGANDSLTNNFSVGDYPGQGNRKITDDGHFGTITLTTLP